MLGRGWQMDRLERTNGRQITLRAKDPREAGVESMESIKNQRPMVPAFTTLSIVSTVYACSQTSYVNLL